MSQKGCLALKVNNVAEKKKKWKTMTIVNNNFIGLTILLGFYAIKFNLNLGWWQNAIIYSEVCYSYLGMFLTMETDNHIFSMGLNFNILAWDLHITKTTICIGPLHLVKGY